jgi:hypothetical protein
MLRRRQKQEQQQQTAAMVRPMKGMPLATLRVPSSQCRPPAALWTPQQQMHRQETQHQHQHPLQRQQEEAAEAAAASGRALQLWPLAPGWQWGDGRLCRRPWRPTPTSRLRSGGGCRTAEHSRRRWLPLSGMAPMAQGPQVRTLWTASN